MLPAGPTCVRSRFLKLNERAEVRVRRAVKIAVYGNMLICIAAISSHDNRFLLD